MYQAVITAVVLTRCGATGQSLVTLPLARVGCSQDKVMLLQMHRANSQKPRAGQTVKVLVVTNHQPASQGAVLYKQWGLCILQGTNLCSVNICTF